MSWGARSEAVRPLGRVTLHTGPTSSPRRGIEESQPGGRLWETARPELRTWVPEAQARSTHE